MGSRGDHPPTLNTTCPVSLDPQFASKTSEIEILINCYEGLFREKSNGKIENLCCESYTKSENGLKYEFNLRDDIFYSDDKRKSFVKEKVKADDFVFAFERLFDPKYPSPHRERFKSIKNAQEIIAGTKPLSSLGVYSKGDNKLVIELREQDSSLIKNLCHTSAMPVSREYFEKTKGKFGVDDDNMVSNGSFKVSAWDKEKFVTIRKNKNHRDESKIFLNGVDFYFNRENTPLELFLEEKLDVAKTDKSELKLYPQLSAKLFKNENAVWVIGFNQKTKALQNESLTNALSLLFDREKLLKELPDKDLFLSSQIVSSGALVNGIKYQDESFFNRYNPIKSKEEKERAMEELSLRDLKGLTILSPADTLIFDSCQNLFQSWQKEMSFFLELKLPETQEEYEDLLQSKDFDLAIFRVVTENASPYSALSDFKKSSQKNYIDYENDQYDALLEKALNEKDNNKARELFKSAEDMLLKTGKIIPLFTDCEYFAIAPNLNNAEIYSYGGLVYFKDAYRK